MKAFILIQPHNHITSLSALLSRERKAPRIQNDNSVLFFKIRSVRMAEHYNIRLPGLSLFPDILRIQRYIISMPVCNKHFIRSDTEFLFSGQI